MPPKSVAVVMPAHNEREGIVGFLAEIREHLVGVDRLEFVVVDDRSTDGTAGAVADAVHDLGVPLTVLTNERNLGHGPSALRAYRAGLELGVDAIIHVDGDGQFLGADFPRLLAQLDEHDAAHGVRRGRTDPWFRRVLTGMVGALTTVLAGGRVPDVNTPFRAYHRDVIARLLDDVEPGSIVPHVRLSILERRTRVDVGAIDVRSIPRRGSVETGTMWGAGAKRPKLPPKRLVAFSAQALGEVLGARFVPRKAR